MRPLLIGFFVCINIHLGYAQWTEQDSIWLKDVLAGKDSIKLNPEFQKAIQSGSFLNRNRENRWGNLNWPLPAISLSPKISQNISNKTIRHTEK